MNPSTLWSEDTSLLSTTPRPWTFASSTMKLFGLTTVSTYATWPTALLPLPGANTTIDPGFGVMPSGFPWAAAVATHSHASPPQVTARSEATYHVHWPHEKSSTRGPNAKGGTAPPSNAEWTPPRPTDATCCPSAAAS